MSGSTDCSTNRRAVPGASALSLQQWAIVLLTALIGLIPRAANAWGDEGHEVIGLIAEHYLKPHVREEVTTLLAGDASNLINHDTGDLIADESTWADKYRDAYGRTLHYRATEKWHYIDEEIDSRSDWKAACFGGPLLPQGTLASQGPPDDCIVNKIEQFRAELANRNLPTAERRLALQFLLHLVGDVHQPLHAADDHDRGGNAKRVRLAGVGEGTLHGFWDRQFVEQLGPNPGAIADSLMPASPSSSVLLIPYISVVWASESNGFATLFAYGDLPQPGPDGVYTLNDDYVAKAERTVKARLRIAGTRLAAVLNEALDR